MTIYKTTTSSKTNNTNSTNESSVGKLSSGQDASNNIPSSHQSTKVTRVVQKPLSNVSELKKSDVPEKTYVDFISEKNRLAGKDMYGEQVVKKAIAFMDTKGWTSTDAFKNKYLPSNHFSKFERVCKHIQSMDAEYARLTDTYPEKIVKDALSTKDIFSSTALYDQKIEIIAQFEEICKTSAGKAAPTRKTAQIATDVKNNPTHVERRAPIGSQDTLAMTQKK